MKHWRMHRFRAALRRGIGFLLFVTALGACAKSAEPPATLVQYGSMHETLALGQHQARVALDELVQREHFYAVGASAGLEGEITILDSAAYLTSPSASGGLQPLDPAGQSATLLVGRTVREWVSASVAEGVPAQRFDAVVGETAQDHRIDLVTPFPFVVEGEFTDVRLHVIHGACPVHARMNEIDLPEEEVPYEWEVGSVKGTLVGVYAKDAVGRITHPATSVHAHLIFDDPQTGERVTGHLEKVGMAPGAVVKVPRAG